MEATHIIKIFINGGFTSEYSALEIKTSKEKALSYCRIDEENGFLNSSYGMMFVDRSNEQTYINFSYDIFYFDLYASSSIEKDGNYFYRCSSKTLGDNVEIFICKDEILDEYYNNIRDYFGV